MDLKQALVRRWQCPQTLVSVHVLLNGSLCPPQQRSFTGLCTVVVIGTVPEEEQRCCVASVSQGEGVELRREWTTMGRAAIGRKVETEVEGRRKVG